MHKQITCSFTGHRPDKLPWGTCEQDPRCQALKQRLALSLQSAYQAGYRHFISGMARGCDFYFSEAVLTLRAQHSDIILECARPCQTQSSGWGAADVQRYRAILDACNYETLVQHHYDRGCMMRRNRYMVDHSSRIIAVYDGNPRGGTAQTLLYAMRCGIDTDILHLSEFEGKNHEATSAHLLRPLRKPPHRDAAAGGD